MKSPAPPPVSLTWDMADVRDDVAARVGRMRNLRPFLERVAPLLSRALAERFRQGGDPSWVELASSTIATKRGDRLPALTIRGRVQRRLVQNGAFGPGNKLIASGGLRDSYVRKGAAGHVEQIDERAGTVVVGSRHRLAAIHEEGTRPYTIRARAGRALAFVGGGGETLVRRSVRHPGVPARPVSLTREDVDRIAGEALAHLEGESAGAVSEGGA